MVRTLAAIGCPVGGHGDDHAHGDSSGCGAQDREVLIYQFIAKHHTAIRDIARGLGISVSDETSDLIARNAAGRRRFSTGAEIATALTDVAGDESKPILQGAHKEVLAVINRRTGTTLDRQAIADVFGPNYQSFNVDVWSFAEAADEISLTEEEIEQKVAAMAYYNLATAGVLCGKNMRVVVLD